MIAIVTSRLTASRSFTPQRADRLLLLLPLIGCILTCASCNDQGPPIVDTTPLGDGLKVIGYAVVGAAVLGFFGKIVK